MFDDLIQIHRYQGEALPALSPLGYDYLIASNGLFLRAENPFIKALLPIASFSVPQLGAEILPQFHLKVPKIPASILRDILQRAQERNRNSESGCESIFFVRLQAERYEIALPETEVSGSISVKFSIKNRENILFECHSHHDMSAFFSSEDNADEQGFRIYGVLGKISRSPECRIRLGIYGHHFALALGEIFEGPIDFVTDAKHDESTEDSTANV